MSLTEPPYNEKVPKPDAPLDYDKLQTLPTAQKYKLITDRVKYLNSCVLYPVGIVCSHECSQQIKVAKKKTPTSLKENDAVVTMPLE